MRLPEPLRLVAALALVAGVAGVACAAQDRAAPDGPAPAAAAAVDEDEPAGDEEAPVVLTDVPGRVVHVQGDWYGLEPEGEEGTRYAPDELPEEFREDGLRVVFSGRVGEIRPDVRMWGTPLELTAIRRAG